MLLCSIMNSSSCVHINLLFFFIILFSLRTTLLITISQQSNESDDGGETIIEEFIICRHCGSDIAITNFFLSKLSPYALSSTNQTLYGLSNPVLVQTLENSLGVQFKVALVRRANCAVINSRWSDHFSWFPGYKWRICLCPKCTRHLGWIFEPSDSVAININLYSPSDEGFYALIIGDILSESYVNSLLMTDHRHQEL